MTCAGGKMYRKVAILPQETAKSPTQPRVDDTAKPRAVARSPKGARRHSSNRKQRLLSLFIMSAIALCAVVLRVSMSYVFEQGSFGTSLVGSQHGEAVSSPGTSIPFPRRVEDILRSDGFKLARSPSEIVLEASYSSGNIGSLLYNENDLKMIVRSLITMRSFMNQGLWSGSPAAMHFIGTGSCLVRMKADASTVASGILHGIYLQGWRGNLFANVKKICDYRYMLRRVIGSELEARVWLETGLFGTGPWSGCINAYNKINEEYEKIQSDRLQNFSLNVPVSMLLCDEVEEAIGGEAILSGHWKRRNESFFESLKRLATYSGSTSLIPFIKHAREMSVAFLSATPELLTKELTPSSVIELYNTTTFSTDARREDVNRWNQMVNIMLNDRPMLDHYNKASSPKPLRRAINASRTLCDSYVAGDMTSDTFVDKFYELESELMSCERDDERFKEHVPMPNSVPDFATVEPVWSPLNKRP